MSAAVGPVRRAETGAPGHALANGVPAIDRYGPAPSPLAAAAAGDRDLAVRTDLRPDLTGNMSVPVPPSPGITPLLVPPDAVPERQGLMAFMSSAHREGEWSLPRLFRALAVMGQMTIDLTQVRIAPGTSDIEVRCIMGEIKIIVPHNLRVECNGHPILGEFKVKRASKARPQPDAPLVRISGVSVMGEVAIKVIDPNAQGWLRRLRGRSSGEMDGE